MTARGPWLLVASSLLISPIWAQPADGLPLPDVASPSSDPAAPVEPDASSYVGTFALETEAGSGTLQVTRRADGTYQVVHRLSHPDAEGRELRGVGTFRAGLLVVELDEREALPPTAPEQGEANGMLGALDAVDHEMSSGEGSGILDANEVARQVGLTLPPVPEGVAVAVYKVQDDRILGFVHDGEPESDWRADRGVRQPEGSELEEPFADEAAGVTDDGHGTSLLEPEPAPPARAQGGSYTVMPGDILYDIARREGTTVPMLMVLNDMRPGDEYFLPIGLELKLPPSGERTSFVLVGEDSELHHWINDGESLSGVARRYGVTVAELKNANPGLKRFRAGETLRLPTLATPPADVEYLSLN